MDILITGCQRTTNKHIKARSVQEENILKNFEFSSIDDIMKSKNMILKKLGL